METEAMPSQAPNGAVETTKRALAAEAVIQGALIAVTGFFLAQVYFANERLQEMVHEHSRILVNHEGRILQVEKWQDREQINR